MSEITPPTPSENTPPHSPNTPNGSSASGRPQNKINQNKIKKSLLSRGFSTFKLTSRLGVGAAKKLLNAQDIDPDKAVEIAGKLVQEFDGMKGLMMKFGQMASYLGTHLPEEARATLATLQSSASAMSFEEVRQVIESDLGAPIEDRFDEFEEQAFAAASIGQVHKATVDGQQVAVKVQYPDIQKLISMDLRLVGNLFTVLMVSSSVSGRALADELSQRIIEECDYRQEARNQLAIRSLWQDQPSHYVPDVVLSRSNERVLTSEFVEGMNFQTFCETASAEAKNKAGFVIYQHAMDAIFKHCYFNGDPHPGNYLFDEHGRVTFLDFGCVKKFDPEFIAQWRRMAKSVLEQDKEENYLATKAMGFIGKEKKFNHDFHWEMLNHVYQPHLKEHFCFDAEYNKETNRYLIWENKNRFSGAFPSDLLMANRLQWGMAAMLTDLGTSGSFKSHFHEAVYSESRPLFGSQTPS